MSADLALDFGTAFTRVADEQGQMLLEEPTAAAVDADTGGLLSFGAEADELTSRSAGRVLLIRPIRAGQLVDIDLGEEVLNSVLRRIGSGRLAHPRILVAVHIGVTEVQRRALDRALSRAGARRVRFVESPIACAVGAGFKIEEPEGTMVVDVGAGRTDIAVLALGGVVQSGSLPAGSDDYDESIRSYLARYHGLLANRATISRLRQDFGTVRPGAEIVRAEVLGRDVSTGTVATAVISSAEISAALEDIVGPILATAVDALTETPPDLANDLLERGLLLAGGGARLDGFDLRLAQATGVPVHVAREGGRLAVIGASNCLSMLDALPASASPSAPR